MPILVIDSHKGTEGEVPTNLHWKNAKQIADYLGADLIWSYPSVNDNIKKGYKKIIFNHASQYNYIDYAWITESPDADIYFISNEYNLGEQPTLWKACKFAGRHYTVIANHDPKISKITKKYVKDWNKVNLNSLVYNPDLVFQVGYQSRKCVYYGSFRKGRIPSFQKYLKGRVVVSTHSKNIDKFRDIGVDGPFVDRLPWNQITISLHLYESSLYLEDEVTHRSYNYLANRFYEAMNYGVPTVFSCECIDTIRKSGYEVPRELIATAPEYIPNLAGYQIPTEWYDKAWAEKQETLKQIKEIVCG
jgi:hypothetical protein